jgi:hypothetical protein
VRGADGVRDKLAALLLAEVPAKIPLLRTAWAAYGVTIPDLDEVVSGESPDMALDSRGDTWVLVINPRLLSVRRTDILDGQPEYMTRYSARVYTWAKGNTWQEAISARDNTAVAVRLALLQYPNLDNQVRGDTGYRLYENTYTEEFGEPLRMANAKGRRVWAGAVHAIDLDCQETLDDGSTREPIGIVQTMTTNATVVGPLQPLPEGDSSDPTSP